MTYTHLPPYVRIEENDEFVDARYLPMGSNDVNNASYGWERVESWMVGKVVDQIILYYGRERALMFRRKKTKLSELDDRRKAAKDGIDVDSIRRTVGIDPGFGQTGVYTVDYKTTEQRIISAQQTQELALKGLLATSVYMMLDKVQQSEAFKEALKGLAASALSVKADDPQVYANLTAEGDEDDDDDDDEDEEERFVGYYDID